MMYNTWQEQESFSQTSCHREFFSPLFEGIQKSTEPGPLPSNAPTESQKSQHQLC